MIDLNDEAVDTAVDYLAHNILTPVIYMCESFDSVMFICLCDKGLELDDVSEVEQNLTDILGCRAAVMDIREFDEYSRIDIIRNAELVYAEGDDMQKVFEFSMAADLNKAVERRKETIERMKECGSVFLM